VEDACFSPGVTFPFRARVRVRYRHEGTPAIVRRDESGEIRVVFDEPVRAVTTGQVAVFYDPASPILARVYGGGKIVAHA
jgi:tRNA-specific 2-thiouridylase